MYRLTCIYRCTQVPYAINKGLCNMSTFLSSDLQVTHPLVAIIRSEKYVTTYDARTHFAVNLTSDQIEVFANMLQSGSSSAEPQERASIAPWVLTLETLLKRGFFAPGPFTATYETDRDTLHQIVDGYKKYVVMRKFCLEVTENCNFRCKYCPYTIATESRRHSGRRLSLPLAMAAIDSYFQRLAGQVEQLPADKRAQLLRAVPPNLSWYGGETLLAFDLIRQTKEYFSSLPWEKYGIPKSAISYSLTTNLSLMTDNIAQFLVDNDVLTYVSIDGPAPDHDKFRVYVNGSGTFNDVYRNLLRLRDTHPEYYRRRVVILSTSCPGHNRRACEDFLADLGTTCFQSEVETPGRIISHPRQVMTRLEADTDREIDQLRRKIASLLESQACDSRMVFESVEKEIKEIPRAMFDVRTAVPSIGNEVLPFHMRTCPIGFDQLLVGADGRYHMCHRTDETLPIGSARGGYDMTSVVDVYQKFHKMLNRDECRSCWAIRFCHVCSAPALRQGEFAGPGKEECECIRKQAESSFEKYQVLSERKELFSYAKDSVTKAPMGTYATDIRVLLNLKGDLP